METPVEFDEATQEGGALRTLPKDWHITDSLSAQCTVNPIYMVPGERVRIPVSVKNGYERPLDLRLHLAGLSRDWFTLPVEARRIEPRALLAMYVILHPPAQVDHEIMEAMLRLSDHSAPDAALTLPLKIVFKRQVNLAGSIQPAKVRYGEAAYFEIQNHTLGATTVHLEGHAETPGLRVSLEHPQIDLLPGQTVTIPVRFEAEYKPLLRAVEHRFAVTAAHENRAPLDFPGKLRVNPRIPGFIALPAMGMLLAGIFLALFLLLDGDSFLAGFTGDETSIPATSTPTETPTTDEEEDDAETEVLVPEMTDEEDDAAEEADDISDEASATPTSTASSTPQPTATTTNTSIPPTPTRTSTPTIEPTVRSSDEGILLVEPATESGDDDPRPAGCDVPIPDGWEPYTVRSGDLTFRLAVDTGTTVNEIARVNCLADPRVLAVGQVLLLPTR